MYHSVMSQHSSSTTLNMYTKIALLVCFAIVAAVAAQEHHGERPQSEGQEHVGYSFEYGVQDPHTHDVHSQKEHREGKNVVGEYTLQEADGTHRVVKYRAGPHIGFEAIVERVGHAQHPGYHGKHGEKAAEGGASYVSATHWGNQGYEAHGKGY